MTKFEKELNKYEKENLDNDSFATELIIEVAHSMIEEDNTSIDFNKLITFAEHFEMLMTNDDCWFDIDEVVYTITEDEDFDRSYTDLNKDPIEYATNLFEFLVNM